MQICELPNKTLYTRLFTTTQGELCKSFDFYYSIYSLVNVENGKRYIGRTQNPKSRISTHMGLLKTGKHPNPLLNQDSGQRFEFEILKDGIVDRNEAKRMERFYMLKYKTYDSDFGYNGNDRMLTKVQQKEQKCLQQNPLIS